MRTRLYLSSLRNPLSVIAVAVAAFGPLAAAVEAQSVLWSARKNGGVVDQRAEAQAVVVDGSGKVFVAGSVFSGYG